jgi:hypothetical protein
MNEGVVWVASRMSPNSKDGVVAGLRVVFLAYKRFVGLKISRRKLPHYQVVSHEQPEMALTKTSMNSNITM